MDSGLRFWFLSEHQVQNRKGQTVDHRKVSASPADQPATKFWVFPFKLGWKKEVLVEIALAELTGKNTSANSK